MPWLLLVIKTYIAYIRVLYLTTGDTCQPRKTCPNITEKCLFDVTKQSDLDLYRLSKRFQKSERL